MNKDGTPSPTPAEPSRDHEAAASTVATSAEADATRSGGAAERRLGTFRRTIDLRRARLGALRLGLLMFAVLAGGSCGTGRPWYYAALAAALSFGVYVLRKRAAERSIAEGYVALRDDPRDGRLLMVFHRDRVLHRIPLAEARARGRTQTLPGVGEVRLQIAIAWPSGALLAGLAVGYRPAPTDDPGLLAASLELDRDASRAFDALSYELPPG